jgi:hypothetical protein
MEEHSLHNTNAAAFKNIEFVAFLVQPDTGCLQVNVGLLLLQKPACLGRSGVWNAEHATSNLADTSSQLTPLRSFLGNLITILRCLFCSQCAVAAGAAVGSDAPGQTESILAAADICCLVVAGLQLVLDVRRLINVLSKAAADSSVDVVEMASRLSAMGYRVTVGAWLSFLPWVLGSAPAAVFGQVAAKRARLQRRGFVSTSKIITTLFTQTTRYCLWCQAATLQQLQGSCKHKMFLPSAGLINCATVFATQQHEAG